jgi:uncharacterized protein involved in exopolysaccharide biosynthesis
MGPNDTVGPAENPNAGRVGAANYLRALRKNAWWIVIIPTIMATGAGIRSLNKPRMYIARASLVPPLEQLARATGLGLGGGLGSQLGQIFGQGSISSLYVDTLKSQSVADAIIRQLDLARVYQANDIVAARSVLRSRSVILQSPSSTIVSVEVRDSDPNVAVAIANAYVDQLDGLNKTLLGGEATSKRVFLGNRVAEIETELSKIENLKTREVQVKEMLYEILSREYELAKIEEAKSLPTIHLLDRASLPAEPVGRGTVKKSLVVGIGVLAVAAFLALVREGLA